MKAYDYKGGGEVVLSRRAEMHRKSLASQDKFSVAEPEGRASGCESAEDSANLCIQRLNAASNNAVDLAFGCDPTEPIATRPLWMQRPAGSYNFFYFHDGNKNVSDLVSYQSARGVPAHYEYAPFGAVTVATTNAAFTAFNVAESNPYTFSSEYLDDALGLGYYNYRHYCSSTGRWLSPDPIGNFGGLNMYAFCANAAGSCTDCLGFGIMEYLPILSTINSIIVDCVGHVPGESATDYSSVSPSDCKCGATSAEFECNNKVEAEGVKYAAIAIAPAAVSRVTDFVIAALSLFVNPYVAAAFAADGYIGAAIADHIHSKIQAGVSDARKENCSCAKYGYSSSGTN